MIVAFVMFKDRNERPLDSLGVFGIHENGLVRAATQTEFFEMRKPGAPYERTPIYREPESELARYRAYDDALRG